MLEASSQGSCSEEGLGLHPNPFTKKGIPMRTVLRALTSSGTYVLVGVIVALTRATASIGARGSGGGSSTQLAPILRAQEDATAFGNTVTGTTEVNSVPIEVPVDGVMMISGTAYVNSFEEVSAIDYILNPKVDGSDATPFGWGAYHSASVNGAPGSRFTLSYTVSQPVSAGSHTVSQELGQYLGGPAEFFYNQNELSVMFVPGSQASVISAAAAATASDRMTPTGQKR
jgi:hypothetical protein